MRKLLLREQVPPTELMGAPEEMEVYLRSFSSNWEDKSSGMRGPLNYYRTAELRFPQEKGEETGCRTE